jgi:hypothetical protein
MEKVIPIHLSSIPRGALVVTIWVCMSTQWEKSVSLSHWLPYTPHGAFVALVIRCGPNGKVFLSTDHPSNHPSIHPNHPFFTHCSCGSWFTIKQITQSGCEPNGKGFCVHPPSIPHGFFGFLCMSFYSHSQPAPTSAPVKDGWMVSGQETLFCWVSVPLLTMVVNSVVSF